MATLTKGKTFGATELVTSTKLSSLVDDGTCTEIVNADIKAAAGIVGSKLDLSTPGIIGATAPAAITGTTITGTTYNLVIWEDAFMSWENEAVTT